MLCLCHSDSIHDMYSILKYHCLRQQQLKQEVYGQPQLACNRVIYSLYNVVPIINDPSDHYQNHPFGDPDSDHPKQTNVPSTNRIMMFQDLHTCDIHYITSHTYICVRYIQIHSISRYIHSILQIYRDIYRYIHYNIYYTNTQYYPLVNIQKTMENHHFQWENPLFQWSFSIAISRYIHILYLYTQQICWPFWSDQNTGLLAVQRRASRIHVRYHMCISKYTVFLFYYILYYTILY